MTSHTPAAPRPSQGLVVAGWVFAVMLPMVGIVLGALAWRRPNHAIGIITLATVLAYVYLFTGAFLLSTFR